MEMHDETIIKKLKEDPDTGFELLIAQYCGIINAVVRSLLRPPVFNNADIEDCIAEVFSEFYFKLHKYSPESGSLKSYLCVIAKNKATDSLRKHYKEAQKLPYNDQLYSKHDQDDFQFDQYTRIELINAIKDLKEPDHEILVRKFYFSESSKEIAKRLNLSVSNVDVRTHRAIKKLKERFGGENNEKDME